LRKSRQRIVGQFAARDSARHEGTDRWHDTRDDLLVVDLRELREALALGDDQADHVLPPRAEYFAHEHVRDPFDHHAGRQIDHRSAGDLADYRTEHRAHELLEQALLVAEIEIDRTLSDVGAFGDVIKPRRRKAARGKLIERSGEDRLAPLRLAFRART